jgi:hypothetical protein
MWVAIHKCMEAMLEISLYSYLYLNLAKTLCLSYYLLCFVFNKIGEQEGGTGTGFALEEGVVDSPNNVNACVHVNKCKNDKIKIAHNPYLKFFAIFIQIKCREFNR